MTNIISEAELGRMAEHYGGMQGVIAELGCDSYEAAIETLAAIGMRDAINPQYDTAQSVGVVHVAQALNVERSSVGQPTVS